MKPLERVGPATADVLEALLNAGEPTWGFRIVKAIGRPAGSVYPILERLESLGWATSFWDDDADRPGPRRRLYLLEDRARALAQAVVSKVRQRTARVAFAPAESRA